mgnify:CR=1 FL=1
MSKVQIVADALGNTIRQSANNPEYGYIRLTQTRSMIGANNFVNVKNLSTLIHGKIEELEQTGLQHTKEINGKIYVVEQVTPFNEENPDRDLKYAGDTGIVCATSDGEPIYRKTFYSEDENVSDTLVPHANGDAIREANGTSAKIMDEVKATKQVDLEDSIAEVEQEEAIVTESTDEVEVADEEGVESFEL